MTKEPRLIWGSHSDPESESSPTEPDSKKDLGATIYHLPDNDADSSPYESPEPELITDLSGLVDPDTTTRPSTLHSHSSPTTGAVEFEISDPHEIYDESPKCQSVSAYIEGVDTNPRIFPLSVWRPEAGSNDAELRERVSSKPNLTEYFDISGTSLKECDQDHALKKRLNA